MNSLGKEVVMRGLMMERPLLTSGLLEHAAAVHGDPEIVSGTDYDQVAVAWQFRWALGFSRNQAPIGTLEELMTNFPPRIVPVTEIRQARSMQSSSGWGAGG
jgi:hypothetical protein